MSDKLDLPHFKAALLEKRALLQELAQVGLESEATVELDQARVGRLSRMDALQGQAMSKEAHRRRDLELKQIAAALQRIEAGDYGECLECGEPIAAPRLEADPAAPLCINCAAGHE